MLAVPCSGQHCVVGCLALVVLGVLKLVLSAVLLVCILQQGMCGRLHLAKAALCDCCTETWKLGASDTVIRDGRLSYGCPPVVSTKQCGEMAFDRLVLPPAPDYVCATQPKRQKLRVRPRWFPQCNAIWATMVAHMAFMARLCLCRGPQCTPSMPVCTETCVGLACGLVARLQDSFTVCKI
jgi:hypothetical protein